MTRAKPKKEKEYLSQREIEGLQEDKREAEIALKERIEELKLPSAIASNTSALVDAVEKK